MSSDQLNLSLRRTPIWCPVKPGTKDYRRIELLTTPCGKRKNKVGALYPTRPVHRTEDDTGQ